MGDVGDGKCGVDDGVDGATAVMEQELVICFHYVHCQVFALFCKMFFFFLILSILESLLFYYVAQECFSFIYIPYYILFHYNILFAVH